MFEVTNIYKLNSNIVWANIINFAVQPVLCFHFGASILENWMKWKTFRWMRIFGSGLLFSNDVKIVLKEKLEVIYGSGTTFIDDFWNLSNFWIKKP